MQIINDRLVGEGGAFVDGAAYGGRIVPTGIVYHDTAGRITKGNTVVWMTSGATKNSYHVIIERDGSWSQMVPFDRRANHAGKSNYRGRGANSQTIGISFVSPGKLSVKNKAYFGVKFEDGKPGTLPTGESGQWLEYTPEQIATARQIQTALFVSYTSLADVTTHWKVSPGRKVDPNPFFPLSDMEDLAVTMRAESGLDILSLGSSGDEVLEVQNLLVGLGYQLGTPDGDFGALTQSAVLSFQAQNALEIDGRVTPDVLAILDSVQAKPFPMESRADATVADLAKKGSRTIDTANAVEIAAGGAVVVNSIPPAVEVATKAIESWKEPLSALEYMSQATLAIGAFISANPRTCLVIVGCLLLFFAIRRFKKLRLSDYKLFKHIGR